ncbi:MAG: hypothetical protein ACLGIG_07105 [Actinomycetes bacterium]
MQLGVLGPLSVWDDTGVELALPGSRLRALLGVLVVHRGHVLGTWSRAERQMIEDALRSGGLEGRIDDARRRHTVAAVWRAPRAALRWMTAT